MATQESQKKQKISHPRRGDIYLVNFDPTIGHDIKKNRPALIIQNDIANQYSPITIVAAITSKFDIHLTPQMSSWSQKSLDSISLSLLSLNQIRSIDRQRLIKRIGRTTAGTM